MGCGASKHGTEVYSASPIPLHGVHAANISPTVAQGDPDEPRDAVSLQASTCATKRQTGG